MTLVYAQQIFTSALFVTRAIFFSSTISNVFRDGIPYGIGLCLANCYAHRLVAPERLARQFFSCFQFNVKMTRNLKLSLHYASTPALFYEQHESKIDPKYSSSLYLNSSDSSELSDQEILTLSSQDLRRTEQSIKGHKSKIFVCKCMANLYSCPQLKLCHENR